MATATPERATANTRAAIDSLSAEDFETASIRSAAPSYTSEAPSYHSTVPNPEPVPPYSPPARSTAPAQSPPSSAGVSSLLGPAPQSSDGSSSPRRQGLPPVPTGPPRHSVAPSLNQFRIPSWSSVSSNPTARQYHNVALRRASAANSTASLEGALRRAMLERIEEEERNRFRPLEDPYLVGEEAAARARRERLARESGDDILIREDRRWDWFLAQMKDREQRERSWKKFRRDVEKRSYNGRLGFLIGARF
ncbi:hypothetical protein N656DRAFT_764291 [Canariomyces notabilis]|uniref:Uncharacterized protein n=1 Tax=Canariomyces notabilis TaxID=2074819 RepID=A0AAN6TM03_9PEZI|nr:hypothetical protein N656DRAFT_764291 [Canariomyces arenarius]